MIGSIGARLSYPLPRNPLITAPAFVLLVVASIFVVIRRQRSSLGRLSGLKSLFILVSPKRQSETRNRNRNHQEEVEKSLVEQEVNLPSTTDMVEKPRPAATRLSNWLNNQLRHSRLSATSTSHQNPGSPPRDSTRASTGPDRSSASSALSLPATFVTRNTNSTFVPATALHYPRCPQPTAQAAAQESQHAPGTATRDDGAVDVHKKDGHLASAFLAVAQPGFSIAPEARVSGLGGIGATQGHLSQELRPP